MIAGVAVFDFDGTVIRGDSVVALLFYARRQGALSLGDLLRAGLGGVLYRLGLTDALTAKRAAHGFLARLSPERREALLRDFAGELTHRAYPEALVRMRAHRERGEAVVLCSASCACYMQYVATLLPVDALLCTPSGPDGQAEGPNCRGQEKVRRVEEWLREKGWTREALVAGYGDSAGDAALLSLCREPVLVNPRRGLRRRLPGAQTVRWRI